MPRSTRHKSSKHKESRDCSDSEKESSLKERKSKEGTTSVRVSKDSDKRKIVSKEYYDSTNGEYYEEEHNTSSKRRKGKTGDDRWNGKDEDKEKDKGESSSKKTKSSSDKTSRRREEEVQGDEIKKKSSDGKHRESSRRESKESEKDRKHHKQGKSDKLYDGEDHHKSKPVSDKTELDQLKSTGTENHTEKRSRRKRDDHGGTGDKHQDIKSDDVDDGKEKGEKSRDKYREEDIKQKSDKQREDRSAKEHHPRSDGKLAREESKKRSKLQDNHEPDTELDGYHDRERNRDYERESDRYERDRVRGLDRDHDYERDRDRGRDRERDRDRYHERDWDRDRSRDRDREHDRERTHDREKDSSRDYYHDGKRSKSDRERDYDRDVSRLDDQSDRYKDGREGSRKSPDYQETRISRVEPDGSVVQEENGNVSDQIMKSTRDAAERMVKMEDGVLGEFQGERSSGTKASPRPMTERSPSSTSLGRRYNNQSGTRRSIEARDFSVHEDERLETSHAELSLNNKVNNSSFPPRPESRSSPRVGPRDEDNNRVNTGGRYKRGVDGMAGRGQQGNNVWRGVPSWPSPLPNGFIQFQPHGGFQTMMQQFPSPSLYGVRPSMEMNHPGNPYHIPDGHMRPIVGWQNSNMDGSGASSHMHGFFGDMSNNNNNTVFRDESNMYGGSDWDHNNNRRMQQSRGWDSRNGDGSVEVSSMSVKDDNSVQVADDESLGGQTSHSAKSVEAGSNLTSPAKEMDATSPKVMSAEDSVAEAIDNTERYCRHYLSKLDISLELTDPEMRKCISVLIDEECLSTDDVTAVFVNLKEGGKIVSKSNSTSLTSRSLFPSQNNSVFQIAMELYKEQRFEIKGLPNVEKHMLPQVENNHVNKGNSSIERADEEINYVSESDTFQKQEQKESTPIGTGMEIERQDEEESSSPKVVASDNNEQDDGAGLDQTMETAPEHNGVPECDISLTIAEDENMEEAEEEEKKEEADTEEVVVGVVSPKVTEPLVNESDESVISRIHQSTH